VLHVFLHGTFRSFVMNDSAVALVVLEVTSLPTDVTVLRETLVSPHHVVAAAVQSIVERRSTGPHFSTRTQLFR